jgi:hypothetical protein
MKIWIFVVLSASAWADESWMERQSRAAFVPKLAVGARGVEVAVPGLYARSIEVFAWIRWPTERRRLSLESGRLAARREQLAVEAAERIRKRNEIAARPKAASMRGQIDDLLDLEEADALLVQP